MKDVRKINEMIRDVARDWHLEHDTRVLVMELGTYFDHITWTNARYIGYNVSAPLTADPETFHTEGPKFLLERLNQPNFSPSIPMVCNKMPSDENRTYCDRNNLFLDGMHMCMESLAARIGAGTACLLGCVYNRVEGSDGVLFEKQNSASSPPVVEKQMLEV